MKGVALKKQFKRTLRLTSWFSLPKGLFLFSYRILVFVACPSNRWANKQIDDFTINIDMGAMQGFYINKTFYHNVKEWNINGKLKHNRLYIKGEI